MISTRFNNGLVLSAMGFVCILLVLISISNTQHTQGYEISIYEVFPFYFWILLIIPFVLPLITLIFETRNGNHSLYLNTTIFGALLSLFILLSLPYFLGYPFYGEGDIYSMLGWIREILLTGHVDDSNPYPGVHILIGALTSILAITPETISLYIRQFFVFIYVVFMFLLAKSLKCDSIESYFVASFAIVPVLGYWLIINYIMPSTDAFFLIPMFLFIIIKSRISNHGFSYSVLSIPLLILFPFFHLEAALFLFITLILLSVIPKIKKIRLIRADKTDLFLLHKRDMSISALILLVGFLLWFMSRSVFGDIVTSVYDVLILSVTPASIPVAAFTGKLGINLSDIIQLIIRQYGHALIYLVMGGLISISTIIMFFFKKKVMFRDIFLSCLFLSFASVNFIFLYKLGTAIGVDFYRQLKYPIFVSTIILGINFGRHFSNKCKSNFFTRIISFLLIICVVFFAPALAVFSLYPTPLILANPVNPDVSKWGKPVFSTDSTPSIHAFTYQPTYSDIDGMEFIFTHGNINRPILEIILLGHQARFAQYLLGPNSSARFIMRWGDTLDVLPPAHFGYDKNRTLGSFYLNDQYLLNYPPADKINQKVYSADTNSFRWHYDHNRDDFEMLNSDPTVSLIYNNGGFKILSVNGISS